MPDFVVKMLSTGAAVLAALAARKMIQGGWRLTTGHDAPEKPESDDYGWKEAILFSAITGALVGVARLLATRGTTRMIGRRPAS